MVPPFLSNSCPSHSHGQWEHRCMFKPCSVQTAQESVCLKNDGPFTFTLAFKNQKALRLIDDQS